MPDSGTLGGETSGEVESPVHPATSRKTGSMTKSRETASLRASLNVYVICLPFHCAPCQSPNRSPQTAPTPLGTKMLSDLRIGFNAQMLDIVAVHWFAT